jgi:signal transduction histidine kinase
VVVAAYEHDLAEARRILNQLPHAVVVVDEGWRIVFANTPAQRIIGTEGDTLWARCPDMDAAAFGATFREAMSSRTEMTTESALPGVGWVQARLKPYGDRSLLITLREAEPDNLEGRQARQALLVGEIGVALTRESELSPMLERCTSAIVRHLDAAFARVWTLDSARGELVLQASSGLYTHLDGPHARVPLGRYKIGQIAQTGEPHLSNSVIEDPQVDRLWARRNGMVGFAGYPLKVEGRVIGVLALFARHKLPNAAIGSIAAVADAIAIGIERKAADAGREAAERQLRSQADRLELLHEIGKQLSAEHDLAPLAQKIANLTTRLSGAQFGAFFYFAVEGGRVHRQAAFAGIPREAFAPLADHPVLRDTLENHELIRCDDLRRDPRHAFELDVPIRSYLAVPVTGRAGKGVGALVFGHERPGAFSGAAEWLVEGVVAQAAIAMDNARLFDEANQLIEQLERTNRDLDQFAYVASHDLKAPLRGISNLSQWIEDDLGEKMDEQGLYHMRLLRGRVNRLEGLIEGILAYSRADRNPGDVTEVDVAQLARDVWELLSPPESARIVIAHDLPMLRSPRIPLQQILMNLVSNAIKYNPDRELIVEIGAERRGEHWALFVKDNGVGIAPEYHDRIWGLFQTLEARDKVESTGIGLAVVRKIVETRGGKSWIESAAGAGATFWFTWPGEARHG